MANKNPHPNFGNKGRLKSGDVQLLLNLFNLPSDIDKIKIKKDVCEEPYIVDEPVYKTVKITEGKGKHKKVAEKQVVDHYTQKVLKRKVIRTSFLSGSDAFAYYVLTGDKQLLKSLLDKLYADQRNIEIDDVTKPDREKLKSLSNVQLQKYKQQLADELTERDEQGTD